MRKSTLSSILSLIILIILIVESINQLLQAVLAINKLFKACAVLKCYLSGYPLYWRFVLADFIETYLISSSACKFNFSATSQVAFLLSFDVLTCFSFVCLTWFHPSNPLTDPGKGRLRLHFSRFWLILISMMYQIAGSGKCYLRMHLCYFFIFPSFSSLFLTYINASFLFE